MEKSFLFCLPCKMLKSADTEVLSFAEGTLEMWAIVAEEGEFLGLLAKIKKWELMWKQLEVQKATNYKSI